MEDKDQGKGGEYAKPFCMHLDTSESSFEMKVLGQFTVESRCYS